MTLPPRREVLGSSFSSQYFASSRGPMEQQQMQIVPRNSGSKRDRDEASATDHINMVAGSDNSITQPPLKKKVTYALPHQNMEEGHYYIVLGEDIDVSTQRFKILSLLGEGTFGKVVEAWDRKRKEYCAVKIVRNVPKYTRDAKIEIQFMEKVRMVDPSDRVPLVKIERYFENDKGHMCIVMPKYGPCLLDWIQKFGVLHARTLARFIFDMGVALDVLHSELRTIHTDLKPENVLLSHSVAPSLDPLTRTYAVPEDCRVRICDLGGCCDERHSKTAIVSTRHYRSPEVILGLGWMFSTDMWSMGCIIYELATGRLLYDTHENLEHLHLMEKTIGRLPTDWGSKCSDDTRSLFSSLGGLKPCTEAKSLARIARARPVRDVIQDDLLRDLIYGLLSYDRTKRTTARQMTSHPYVAKYYPESLQHPNHPNNRRGVPPSPLM